MIYKIHSVDQGQTIFARIDDDGLCRLTCTKDYPEFQAYIMDGGELQDANGIVMTDAQAFIQTLPQENKMAKFPDLTGDGEVTKADVLKGRGVFKKGGEVS